jgi:AraC-like DNA-binding protein
VSEPGGGQAGDRSRQSFLASMGQTFRRLLELHGLDAVGIARHAGVDLAAIPAPGERIEVDKIDAILRVAIPRIPDPGFGLHAARCWHPSELGVLGYAWLSSSTLRTGLERAVRYSRLIGERGITEIEDTRQGLKVRFWAKRGNPAVVPVAAVFADIAMALLFDLCRMNAGAALRPVAATLRRRKPDPADAYERFFGCPVQFGAEENTFVLSAKDADRPLPSANRQLAAVFDQMLTEALARLDKSDVVSRARAAVLEHLSSGEGTAEDAAKQLHMSPRTLQRKLAEAKTTYLQLVDDTRKDLALRYIEDPRRSVTDITFSLGFSQPSAFTRAFKRWTGLNPSDYRTRSTPSR